MDRRGFIAVVGGSILAAPLAIEAQQLSRVGVLLPGIPPAAVRDSAPFRAHRDALAQLGYRDGQNLVLEVRSAERQTALGELAQELVQLHVDVIVAGGVASARQAKAATRTIPIVGVGVGGDPVAMGLAQSIAAPRRKLHRIPPRGNRSAQTVPALAGGPARAHAGRARMEPRQPYRQERPR